MAFGRKKKVQQPQPKGNFAFIDSQNLNLGTQKVGWKMDWRKFRKLLADKYNVSKAFLFIGYIKENEDMYNQLHDAGYLIVLKPTQEITKVEDDQNADKKSDDKKLIKGNIDAELVLWAMKEVNNYDKAIVVSGDGDFYCLVEYLHEQGKLLKLMVPNKQYSNLLNAFEEHVVRLDNMKNELAYRNFRRGKGGKNGKR